MTTERRRTGNKVAAGVLAVVALAGCGQGAEPVTDPTTSSTELPCGAPPADQRADEYGGLSEADATARATDDGFSVRVVGRDGECFAITDDYRTDRVNLYVADDDVVWAARF